MRRRLTFAFVGLVAAALLIAGSGTVLITRTAARDQAVKQLRVQSEQIAQVLQGSPTGLATITGRARRPTAQQRLASQRILALFRQIIRANDVVIASMSSLRERTAPIPAGIGLNDLQPANLASGNVVSGYDGNLAFSAAPFAVGRSATSPNAVVVVTRTLGDLGPSWAYFVLVGGITLVIAAVVAITIGRRISRPLEGAVAATGKIAKGDLGATVPIRTGDYPELVSLAESINTMAQALSRSRGLERQFLLSVSHDLRTPLTSIRGYAEALTDGAVSDPERAGTVIATEAQRLERLVNDLLELARLDSKQFSLRIASTDSLQVVRDTAEGFRPLVERSGLDLAVDTAEHGPLLVRADPERLSQVLANLVENAVNFARNSVAIRLHHDNGSIAVSVEDDGPGIPRPDLDHVFERFYQSARTPARHVGSGLGLAIVAELASAMGASVSAKSPTFPAGGTRMVLRLRPWADGAP